MQCIRTAESVLCRPISYAPLNWESNKLQVGYACVAHWVLGIQTMVCENPAIKVNKIALDDVLLCAERCVHANGGDKYAMPNTRPSIHTEHAVRQCTRGLSSKYRVTQFNMRTNRWHFSQLHLCTTAHISRAGRQAGARNRLNHSMVTDNKRQMPKRKRSTDSFDGQEL